MNRLIFFFLFLFSTKSFAYDWVVYHKDPNGLEDYGIDHYYDKSNVTKTPEGFKNVTVLANFKDNSQLYSYVIDCGHSKLKDIADVQMYSGPFASGSMDTFANYDKTKWFPPSDPASFKLIKSICGEKEKLPGVKIGDTADYVIHKTSWGKPNSINRTTNKYGTHEQWVYGNGNYLYFDNGVLTSIQN